MRPPRSAPIADVAGTTRDIVSFAQVEAGHRTDTSRQAAGGAGSKGRVFRRKIDCGTSTETSAERLVLRDPDHLLRSSRRTNR
jgi:hypothetical protein